MSATRKLSDLGKNWSSAPGWANDTRRAVSPLRHSQRSIEKPESLGEEFRRQYEIWRSEHPQAVPQALPPMEQAAFLENFDVKRAARIGLIAGGAALAAFYLAGVFPNLNGEGFQPQAAPEPLAAKQVKTARLDVPPMPVAAKSSDLPAWPEASSNKQGDRIAPQGSLPTKNTDMAAPNIEVPAARIEAPVKPARTLPVEEIDLMLKRGEEFIVTGDLAAARLVLERAARAHDARAAFALASTYDPAVLKTMKAVGTAGDLELAIMWYERAKQYGSRDAGPRLLALAGRD